jgi:putative tricarboxylic transport membrane protein
VKREDIGSSLFWLVISLGIVYGGYDLGLGSLHQPGSGFIFFWVGIIMIGLSLGIFFHALRAEGKAGEAKDLWSGVLWWKIISVSIALLVYAYSLTDLGFILSTTLLLIFIFRYLGPQSWRKSLIQALLSSAITYWVFGIWLNVQFPRGFLGIG